MACSRKLTNLQDGQECTFVILAAVFIINYNNILI